MVALATNQLVSWGLLTWVDRAWFQLEWGWSWVYSSLQVVSDSTSEACGRPVPLGCESAGWSRLCQHFSVQGKDLFGSSWMSDGPQMSQCLARSCQWVADLQKEEECIISLSLSLSRTHLPSHRKTLGACWVQTSHWNLNIENEITEKGISTFVTWYPNQSQPYTWLYM